MPVNSVVVCFRGAQHIIGRCRYLHYITEVVEFIRGRVTFVPEHGLGKIVGISKMFKLFNMSWVRHCHVSYSACRQVLLESPVMIKIKNFDIQVEAHYHISNIIPSFHSVLGVLINHLISFFRLSCMVMYHACMVQKKMPYLYVTISVQVKFFSWLHISQKIRDLA